MTQALRSVLGLAVLATAAAAAGQVHVVDDDGGADFTTLEAAVAAAADGDLVLVKSGSYDGFTIDGKELVVTADQGELVGIEGTVTVQNLAADQCVELRGLVVFGTLAFFGVEEALTLQDNAGRVWVEDCTAQSAGLMVSGKVPTVSVTACASVAFARCTLLGWNGSGAEDGGDALCATDSQVWIYDSTLTGGQSGSIQIIPGIAAKTGGSGLRLTDGFAFASGTDFAGGPGGPGSSLFGQCSDGGNGGDGATLEGPAPELHHLDSTFTAGAPGQPGSGDPPCSAGLPGQDLVPGLGSVTAFAGEARPYSITSPVREATDAALHFEGQDGDFVFLDISFGQGDLYFPQFTGVLLLEVPVLTLFLGNVGASGALDLSLTVGTLAPGKQVFTAYTQFIVVDAALVLRVGSPSSLTILDSGF